MWEHIDGFPTAPGFEPNPQFNSSFQEHRSASEHFRCFVFAKIHENNGTNIVSNGTEMFELVLEDMAGSVRAASVWPPLIKDKNIWTVGTVLSTLGLAPLKKVQLFHNHE